MSTVKTLTSSLTAIALVTGISFAWAQSEEQSQPTNTTTAPGAMPSEQTPADPNALPPVDTTTPLTQQQQQQSADTQQPAADAQARSLTPDTSATPLPSDSTAAQDSTYNTTTAPSYDEPAPRADRN